MSVLFPKVPKPREWDYRPIYYDKEKEARKEKLARLHHGSFLEEHEKHMSSVQKKHSSRLAFWVALLLLLLFAFWYVV